MTLTVEDRLAIYELISLHGHLMDAGAFDRLDDLFTEDFVYDVEALGFGCLEGFDARSSRRRGLWATRIPSATTSRTP